MSRQLGDERARYPRCSLREQVDDLLAWPASHRIATLVVVGFFAVGAILWATRGLQLQLADLAVGDCLFARTDATQSAARPIGDSDIVAATILAGGAERASCSASHGHEVSAIVEVPAVPPIPSGVSVASTVRAAAMAACESAFDAYVGAPPAGSRYETFPVLPSSVGNTATAVCLVARRDGQWMDHPARGSGE